MQAEYKNSVTPAICESMSFNRYCGFESGVKLAIKNPKNINLIVSKMVSRQIESLMDNAFMYFKVDKV
jgi:hypothetical protein